MSPEKRAAFEAQQRRVDEELHHFYGTGAA
jgi:hypothetical protein